MNELALFAGAGGGILGGHLLGWKTVCAVEIEDYPRRVLLARQRDGILPRFPIWDDIRTFDGKPWKGRVDVVSGGFPCKGISPARTNSDVNGKQGWIGGTELWGEMFRIIGEVKPQFVLVENSQNLRTKGLALVLQDLDRMGYNTARCKLGCRQFGADHIRNRMWIVANSDGAQRQGGRVSSRIHQKHTNIVSTDWWESEPEMERVAHGLANWVDRLKAIGNGQVPAVVRLAWNTLTRGENNE